MKKTLKAVIAAILALSMVFVLFGCMKPKGKPEGTKAEETNTEAITQAETGTNKNTQTSTDASAESSQSATNNPTKAPEKAPATGNADFSKVLFIGDSRTVGLSEYTDLPSDFFCDVGLSAKNSLKKTISVKNVGKVTLADLLKKKQYERVYIMLGINEIGGRLESIVKNYSDVVSFVRSAQPNASVVIMANLHVTKERSDSDASINNERINAFNNEVKKLADGKNIFYIDVNTVFDDASGALKDDMTSDNVHLYAKYYKEWAAWIVAQPLK